MRTDTLKALRGPNLWSDETILEVVLGVDGPPLSEPDRRFLLAALPTSLRKKIETILKATLPSGDATMEATLVAAITWGISRELGCEIGLPVIQVLEIGKKYRVLVEYLEEETGRKALALAEDIITAARGGVSLPIEATIKEMLRQYESNRLGPSTGAIVRAAQARGIPTRRLTDGSLVMMGYGSKQRRIWAAETDRTSAIAESIAQDKDLTKLLLSTIGVPVPEGRPVETAEEAWEEAQKIGCPVVVKPRKGNQGRGVSVGLQTKEAVRLGFEIAATHGDVMVERHVDGKDFRLLVIGGRLIAAARREVPTVTGDGEHTIAQLVDIANLDPRRGEDHATCLSKLRLDAIGLEMLGEQGFTPDTIPEKAEVVILRRNANLSTGGSAVDVTDTVHPEVAERAIEAATMIGLDIAGIDIVATSIEQPLDITRGAIVEVNAAPGLRMHIEPSEGTPRPVGEAIINATFQAGDNARIPIVAVSGTNGKTTTTRCISYLLERSGRRVGMTTTDGIYIEGRRIDTDDCSGPKSARAVLANPRVDAAVLETARGGILREGLGFDFCDVAVVTNLGEGDHLGMGGITTTTELARVKAVPVRRVSSQGAAVLNADDPLVVGMARQCRGTVIYFSRDANTPVIVAHRAAGGKAVTIRDGHVIIAVGREERRVARVADLALAIGGRVPFQVDNLLAATAAGYALGLSLETIGMGIETFTSDVKTVPGRFNVLSHRGSTLILDYGHNADALLALVDAIGKMPHSRSKIVYTAAGDRRDEDILRQARIIGEHFDEIYIYEDQCTRGRPDGEIIKLMRRGLGTRGKIIQESGELAAISAAIASLTPGELLLCQIDQIDLGLAHVASLIPKALAPLPAPVKQKSNPATLPATIG
jgi:cyanophycin synthetase